MGLKYSVTALGCRPNTENVTMQHRNIHSNNNNKCKFSEFLDTTMSQDTAVADVEDFMWDDIRFWESGMRGHGWRSPHENIHCRK